MAPLALVAAVTAVAEGRREMTLETGWRSALAPAGEVFASAYLAEDFNDSGWESIEIPHNWDDYAGSRQLKHGNLHGTAWYRRTLDIPELASDERVFLFFEGVGSYATVWLNGAEAGRHAGGLTTFTLDITAHARAGAANLLVVRAEHPAGIRDLPWVCGGCELAYGFSEGPQPFGIFRPVHLVVTNSLRIAPFGVHVWNGRDISADSAALQAATELRNHGARERALVVRTTLLDADGEAVVSVESAARIAAGGSATVRQDIGPVRDPRLWSLKDPHLYTVTSELIEDGRLVDRVETPYGIRWIEWPDPHGQPGRPLLLNGEPVFINGVADYEHLLGGSHAFGAEQVLARARQVRAAGFNAFRDAHHPHNLRFNAFWDRAGILWWTQFGAHIWFNTPAFRDNYKALLRDWIRERRNSPSLFLYGLQNESKLPEDFARECVAIIREMDPTASSQRLVTTCNGGAGTDWDVPQNWSGTYGGDLHAYADELRGQRMVGEYGAWRSIDLHSEDGFDKDGPLSEERMAAVMETKVRLAEQVRGEVIGHFAWPFTTHHNPGRNTGGDGQQTMDGAREWDRIGPANNKGLLTIWGEPLDVFHMYRSNYADPLSSPMVYIVSHTWPDRWSEPGQKDGIIVYSNADEVELFNGYKGHSLGVRRRGPPGTHFHWDGADIRVNVLYAEARIGGKTVATDLVQLHHLPQDPGLERFDPNPPNLTAPEPGWHYLYRVNAGGDRFTDANGGVWEADRRLRPGDAWGSVSWADRYSSLHPFFGSKRRIHDPVRGTRDDALFQSFRYGRGELAWRFAVPDGDYRIELYFTEPWYGTGGGMDCTGWRLFDVAVNGVTLVRDLDLWSEAGRAGAVRKVVEAQARGGWLEVSFPRVAAGQAVISAIAVAGKHPSSAAPARTQALFALMGDGPHPEVRRFMDTGRPLYADSGETITRLSWELRESDWIMTRRNRDTTDPLVLRLHADADVFVAFAPGGQPPPAWLDDWAPSALELATTGDGNGSHTLFSRRSRAGDTVRIDMAATAVAFTVIVKEVLPDPPPEMVAALEVSGSAAPDGWRAYGNLRAGQRLHGDDDAALAGFSSRLGGCDWIQTPLADAAAPGLAATFTVRDHCEVFVALDRSIIHPPGWMEDWIPTDWYVSVSGEDSRRLLHKKRFAPGDTVHLGTNGRAADGAVPGMYGVIVRTVRADQVYPVDSARRPAPGRMDWTIEVGVGDRYGLNFSYRSGAGAPAALRMSIISMRDGLVVCEDALDLPPTGGEWGVSRYRTCDAINAGTYLIRLEGDGLDCVGFSALQVE